LELLLLLLLLLCRKLNSMDLSHGEDKSSRRSVDRLALFKAIIVVLA
jgi:hypothetical protein